MLDLDESYYKRAIFFAIINWSLYRSHYSRTINDELRVIDVYFAHKCQNFQLKVTAKREQHSGNELRGCRNKLCSFLESCKIDVKRNEKIICYQNLKIQLLLYKVYLFLKDGSLKKKWAQLWRQRPSIKSRDVHFFTR